MKRVLKDVVTKNEETSKGEAITLMLPKDMRPSKEDFEHFGFTFEDVEDDEMLCKATLPVGWTITKDGNWSEFFDETGRKRGSSFHKVKAHMSILTEKHL